MNAPKARVGDVFLIPVDERRHAVAQILAGAAGRVLYLAVLDCLVTADQHPEKYVDEAFAADLVFLAPSLDAKLHAGHWTVIGSRAPVRDVLPVVRELHHPGGGYLVVDHAGDRRRPADAEEVRRLPDRFTVAPVRLEKAVRARYGGEPWADTYDKLLFDEERTVGRYFPST